MKRIVTENGPDGASRIMSITTIAPGDPVWESSSAEPLGSEPRKMQGFDFLRGGIRAVHLSLPTEADMADYLKAGVAGLDDRGFHRTGTLDLLMLLEGELSLELDDGTVALSPGDVVVQRDTNHAWRNTGSTPARCFAIVSTPGSSDLS